MQHTPPELVSAGWNRHPLTLEDFDRVCASLDPPALVVEAEMEPPGMYFERRGRPVIVLNCALSGMSLAAVAWHELAHVLLHAPGIRFFVRGSQEKAEHEAEIVAACALIPRFMIEHFTEGELLDEGFPPELLKLRREIYETSNT